MHHIFVHHICNQSIDHIDNKIVINLLLHHKRVKYKHTPHKGVVPLLSEELQAAMQKVMLPVVLELVVVRLESSSTKIIINKKNIIIRNTYLSKSSS